MTLLPSSPAGMLLLPSMRRMCWAVSLMSRVDMAGLLRSERIGGQGAGVVGRLVIAQLWVRGPRLLGGGVAVGAVLVVDVAVVVAGGAVGLTAGVEAVLGVQATEADHRVRGFAGHVGSPSWVCGTVSRGSRGQRTMPRAATPGQPDAFRRPRSPCRRRPGRRKRRTGRPARRGRTALSWRRTGRSSGCSSPACRGRFRWPIAATAGRRGRRRARRLSGWAWWSFGRSCCSRLVLAVEVVPHCVPGGSEPDVHGHVAVPALDEELGELGELFGGERRAVFGLGVHRDLLRVRSGQTYWPYRSGR